MSLGQNEQFFYSPDVRIFINSITEGGIIEVSDDFMSLTIDRNINAVSTASIYLANNGFKYTPASKKFSAPNVPPPVINTMDEIIIFLKKENYYQYFTGFVTYTPIVTLIPEPILINASCTLYKAQNSFWDAGAIEYEGIIPGILQNAQIFGGNVQSNDGGVATGMTRLLTMVANWDKNDIHIGGIPSQWVSFATDIYKQTQIQLKDKNVTSFKDIINFLEVTGNSASSVTDTTTQGANGVGGTTPSLGVHGAPTGTALEGITSGESITATVATVAEMSNYTTARTKFNKEADVIVNNVNDTQYWIAAPFTYFSSSLGDNAAAKEWLSGGGTPQTYPGISQVGRLLIVTNTITHKTVQVHVAYSIKNSLHLNGADIILSEAAFIALGGKTSPGSNTLSNISVDAWVGNHSKNLSGGPVAAPVPPSSRSKGAAPSPQPASPNGGFAQWEYNLLNPKLGDSNLNSFASPSAKARNSTYEQWEYELLRGIGASDPNLLPVSLEALARMAHLEGGAWHSNWLNVSSTPQYPLTGATGVLKNNQDYIAVFPNAASGIAGTIEFFRNSTYLNAFKQQLLNPNATLASIAVSIPTNVWGQSDVNAVLNGSSAAPINQGNPNDIAGLNSSTGNFNSNTTQGVVGFDANSTILAGSPRAFITDVSALSTLTTLSTMGLREFQSGPDGSFLSWYPDYFGLYGTAPVLSIYDIEIIDFSIYHDDTQLYTHIGVSGDPTSIGSVSLVDWLMTNGIITIENNAILGLLFGTDPATISTSMNSLISQKIDVNTFAKQFLKRYGMRPYVDSEPMIRSELMEFMYALQEFLYLWSQQYATNVTLTFMPELYPGMLIEIADHGLQVYVQSVSQSCSRDGGFTTNAVVTSPTRIIGKKKINENGKVKVINNVVPLDFGYPITHL